MLKHALAAIFGLFSLGGSLAAQQPADETITLEQMRSTGEVDSAPALTLSRLDLFSRADGSLLIHGLPALVLLDGRRFAISNPMGRMGMTPLDLFPVAFLSAVEVEKVSASPRYGTDAPGGVVNLRLNREYSGGEVGLFYGRSSGKFGGDEKQAYILGGVGNEKLHVTAGAAYEESSVRVPQLSR